MLLFCAKVSKKCLTAKEKCHVMSYFLLFNDCLQNYQTQNGVTSLQIFKNLPQNWDTFMHTVQKSAPKLRHVYATPA